MGYNSIKQILKSTKTLRCLEVIRYLEKLGFMVRSGKKSNHKVYTHFKLSLRTDFKAGSFSCEHGVNGEVKRNYINKIVAVLNKYETALKELGEEGK